MPRTRVLTTPVALPATLLVLLGLLAAPLTTAQAVPVDAGAHAASVAEKKVAKTVVLRARAIPMAAPEIANPMRGQYEWLGQAPSPAGFPVKDVYYRDTVSWSRIEPQPGVYDFSLFDEGLARAHELGGRFGFRVMASCPGCWLDSTPTWLPRQPGSDQPDYNSEVFLSAWERLMAEIGRRYAGDPALGWVDVGGYGAWGEWHVLDGAEITVPNAVRLMTAVLDAFSTQHVIINAMVPKYVDAAMALSPRIGLRVDCLGEFNMFSLLPTSPVLQERWRTAPVLSEWCLTPATSTVLGAQQVRQFHISQVSSPNGRIADLVASDPASAAGLVDAAKSSGYRYVPTKLRLPRKLPRTGSFSVTSLWRNDGSAPTYDDWRVTVQLRKRGQVVRTADLGVDLRTVLPGTSKVRTTLGLGRLRPGAYSVWLTVTDPAGYLAPMNLAVDGGRDGAYPMGKVRVGRGRAH
jgi:hypothetical protein